MGPEYTVFSGTLLKQRRFRTRGEKDDGDEEALLIKEVKKAIFGGNEWENGMGIGV